MGNNIGVGDIVEFIKSHHCVKARARGIVKRKDYTKVGLVLYVMVPRKFIIGDRPTEVIVRNTKVRRIR